VTLGLAILAPHSVLSQASGSVVELKSANELNVRTIGGEEVRDFVGNVHFVQPAENGGIVNLWCDRALQFVRLRRIECYGNVKVTRDSTILTAPEGTYYDGTRHAKMIKGVRLERPRMVLTAVEGDYDTGEKRAHFRGNVVVTDSLSVTACDDLTYFETDDRSISVGHVSIVGRQDAVTVYGDSLVHYGTIDYTIVPLNPKLVQVDTTGGGLPDTLVVTSRMMEAFRDTSLRYVARDSVVIARDDLAAICGDAVYRPAEGLVILRKQPVVWYDVNQISGDSIAVRLRHHRLESVYVHGRAMAISRADTSSAERFDQLTGREITLYFSQGGIERIEAERQATSLYYLFDRDLPNGANKSSGDSIIVNFQDGLVDRIKVVGGVEGEYLPEPMIRGGREQLYNLDGFKWYANRPRRRGVTITWEE